MKLEIVEQETKIQIPIMQKEIEEKNCYVDEKTGLYYQVSNDKKNIEMGYEIPEKEITRAKGINIVKNPTDRWGNSIIPKYEQYRISDNDMKFGIYFKRR